MDMRVIVQILAPAMKHGNESDLGAEVFGIGADAAQRLGRGAEQDGVDHLLVLERDLGHRRGQREDDVEIGHRQQLCLPGREPFGAGLPLAFGAVPVAAGIVGAADEPAVQAGLGVTAQFCRSAQLDGTHHPPLDAAEMAIVCPAIGVAVATEHIRHFKSARHWRPAQAGGTTSSLSRSSGLSVRRINPFDTCV